MPFFYSLDSEKVKPVNFMIYRDKLEQEIINDIIELDKKGSVIGINNLISINYLKTGEELLIDGHYISIDHDKKECLFKVATYSQLERKELEKYFEHVCKILLLIFVLIEDLRDERYVLIVGDSKPSAIGSAFGEEFDQFPYQILYLELEQKLLELSGKEFIPTKKLIDYVKNGFKSLDELALEEQLKSIKKTFAQQENSIKWSRWAVVVASIAVIISAIPIITSFFKTETIKLIDTEIHAKILNESFKISTTKDTVIVRILSPEKPLAPVKK